MSKPKAVACLLIPILLPLAAVGAEKRLTQAQAEELLLNTPNALEAKEKRGCPAAHLLWQYDRQASLVFSMRDPCSKYDPDASDLMGVYTVDLRLAEVWTGVDRRRDHSNVIDSPRLKELRQEFLGRRKVNTRR